MLTCFAHRGASGHAPENTLLAFEKAISLGCAWIELDVRCSADGRVMVVHDEYVDRTTSGSGRISELSFEYLRSLDAGKGERIPTLREVLEIAGRRIGLNIEIKVREAIDPTITLIREYAANGVIALNQVLFSSFDLPALALIRDRDPEIPLGACFFGVPQRLAADAEDLGCRSVHAASDFTNLHFIEDTHRRGLQYFVYTVNNAQQLKHIAAMGVDGVFSDYPEICRAG